MAKECAICKSKIGLLSSRLPISSGAICSNCAHKAGIHFDDLSDESVLVLQSMKAFDCKTAKEMYKYRVTFANCFRPTQKVGHYLAIDEKHQSFRANSHILGYQNLLKFEFVEDDDIITSGNLGSAITGGLLFGPTGAIVGGIVGSTSSSKVCSSMAIRLVLKNAPITIENIIFIKDKTKRNSAYYKTKQSQAYACLTALQQIIDANTQTYEIKLDYTSTYSVADEILKLKNLLDAGIISTDEFEGQKEKLLTNN